MTYRAHTQAAKYMNMNEPVPPPMELEEMGQRVGFTVLIDSAVSALNLLPSLPWPPAQAASAQAFVLHALDVIPRTKGFRLAAVSEATLLSFIQAMPGRQYDPSFRNAVTRKWNSSEVSDVLRSRGVLQLGASKRAQELSEFDARRCADIEKMGLRGCALPSCDVIERTVREFKQCSACRSAVYCSQEHQMLDWGAHKTACGALRAARRDAAPQGGPAQFKG